MTNFSELQHLDLSKNEINTYVATLKLGGAKASTIANQTKLQREAIYYTLKLLREKGLVNELIKSGVKYYYALNPEELPELIEQQKQEQLSAIKDALPKLLKITNTSLPGVVVEQFIGISGLKTVFLRMLNTPNIQLCALIGKNIISLLSETYNDQFLRKRKEKNIRIKALAPSIDELQNLKKSQLKHNRELRFASFLKKTDTLTYILPEAYILIKANESYQSAIYIKDKQLASVQKNMFDALWDFAELK